MQFAKMHTAGNDFVVVDRIQQEFALNSDRVKRWGNRRTGLGFDQLLCIEPPQEQNYDFNLLIYNSDGSVAKQCGNGSACVALYLETTGIGVQSSNMFRTAGGLVTTNLMDERVQVRFEPPVFEKEEIPFVGSLAQGKMTDSIDRLRGYEVFPVGMGNPHAVVIDQHLSSDEMASVSAVLQSHDLFPDSVNVEFLTVRTKSHGELRIFERGAGETQACGSGACAVAAVGIQQGWFNTSVTLDQPGGSVEVSWDSPDSQITLLCTPEFVYKGQVDD